MLMVDRGLVSGVLTAQAGEDLHEFVQSALELEHSIIPPYLTAYYILRPAAMTRSRLRCATSRSRRCCT
jgi:hypothetical protein